MENGLDAGGVGTLGDDLQRPRGTRPERLLHLRVADARAVALRNDLDRRHPGIEPENGHGQEEQNGEGRHTVERRAAPEPLAPSREAR